MNFDDPKYFKSWSFTVPVNYFSNFQPPKPSVEQIIAQHDIYDSLLENMERFPQAEQMLADIGIK